jgi:hypothetical protein
VTSQSCGRRLGPPVRSVLLVGDVLAPGDRGASVVDLLRRQGVRQSRASPQFTDDLDPSRALEDLAGHSDVAQMWPTNTIWMTGRTSRARKRECVNRAGRRGLGLPADDRTPTASFCLDEQSDRHSDLADVRANWSCMPAASCPPDRHPRLSLRGSPNRTLRTSRRAPVRSHRSRGLPALRSGAGARAGPQTRDDPHPDDRHGCRRLPCTR